MKKIIFLFLPILFCNKILYAQTSENITIPSSTLENEKSERDSLTSERDLADVLNNLLNKKNHPHLHKPKIKSESTQLAFIPGGGYSTQTGLAIVASSNLVFYTDKKNISRESSMQMSAAFTQKSQIIVPFAANIWSKTGNYNFISDIRFMNYPSKTFGLGPKQLTSNESDIDFNYLRIHQTVLRKIIPDLFAGIGFYYDRFWDIKEINPPTNKRTSFQRYGFSTSETAVGINLQAVFDDRDNSINPKHGWYASVRYRTNQKTIGSDANWEQSIIEIKKYFTFPSHSKNVLAFWSYSWLTTNGKPPYLLLPSTGWDDFFNTGRGYLQSRYRDKDMSYLEAEYRFRLTKNGLLGGVVFANVQTFSTVFANEYQTLLPGYGLGLRVKLNKHSDTNLCIDYGRGRNGSSGIFINLGEVF